MYWWTNIAVKEDEKTRIFSGADEVLYIKPDSLDGDVKEKVLEDLKCPILILYRVKMSLIL